jgi:signal peptidase I
LSEKNLKGEIIDFLKDLVWIVVIVVIIRSFLAEPFQISGQSMADSYYNGEFIIVNRFSYLDIPVVKT